MIWLTPSSRKAHVVARSAVEAGIGRFWRDMVVELIGERVKLIRCHQVNLFIFLASVHIVTHSIKESS